MPLVIGALTVGMLSVFSLNTSVTGRLTDSTDAQQVSLAMQNDVQSATCITMDSSPTSAGQCPSAGTSQPQIAPCLPAGTSQRQIMAVLLGNGDEVSYAVTQSATDKGDSLWRYECQPGSTTPSDTTVVAHDVAKNLGNQPGQVDPFTVTCTPTASACVTTAGVAAYQVGWVSTVGITSVTFKVTTPDTSYSYQVTAVPLATANTVNPSVPVQGKTNCNFAVASSGTYAQQLCFVDFSPWNTQTAASYTCQPAGANQLMLPMAQSIANTPFTLEFCMYVSGSNGQGPITGKGSAPPACGVAGRTGYNDIAAVPLPTYACPGSDGSGSEAFLGNNGFYTGVGGDPALYEVKPGSTATITFDNIRLVNSNDQPATGWKLVTGDAESTDQGESMTWQSDQRLALLPNSPDSPIGNACDSIGQYAPPNYNSVNGLTGVNTTQVTCANSPSLNHTGTPMLQATTPSSLTVTMVGGGLEATFLGVILP